MIVDLPVIFGGKPYSGENDSRLPSNVRKMSPKKRRQWIHIFNSELASHGDESRAFRTANGGVKSIIDLPVVFRCP